jgi:hypothetical protein
MTPTRYIRTGQQRIAARLEEELADADGQALTYRDAVRMAADAGSALGPRPVPDGTASNALILLEYAGVLEPIFDGHRIRPSGYLVHTRRPDPEPASTGTERFTAAQHRRLARLATELEGRSLAAIIEDVVTRWAEA